MLLTLPDTVLPLGSVAVGFWPSVSGILPPRLRRDLLHVSRNYIASFQRLMVAL